MFGENMKIVMILTVANDRHRYYDLKPLQDKHVLLHFR